MEDSSVFREMQGLLLEKAGFAVSAHESPSSALAAATRQQFDLVVLDYELPEMNGQQFMVELRAIQPDIAVVFVSGVLTLDLAIKLSSQGVAGIFNKPANPKILLERITETIFRHGAGDSALRAGSLPTRRAGRRSSPPPSSSKLSAPSTEHCAYTPQYVFGSGGVFRDFTHRLWKVREFRSVLLLQGERGSPFELFGRELVDISQFREGPVMVCRAAEFDQRAVIEKLAPSLLSHDPGTLIVTDVESFTGPQQRLLESLIAGRDVFQPFVRRFRLLLAATNKLPARVEEGAFGETLFYKISALSLTVPSLREMSGDIAKNALRILRDLRGELKASTPVTLAPDAATLIEAQLWPGNYAQLADTIRAAALQCAGRDALDVPSLRAANVRDNPFRSYDESAASLSSVEEPPDPWGASFFRPASGNYRFAERLTAALQRAATVLTG